MSKKIIGSKMAAELARKKFGDKAYVSRGGKLFEINVLKSFPGRMSLIFTKGRGKSWAEALTNAGVVLPIEATIAGEVLESLHLDTMPTDTDAKEPDNGNE